LRPIEFTKMQGLGNDFILVEGPASFTHEEVARLCDRRFGIGADGVLVATRLDPVRMEYWNADGSAAEMCGNGLRCVARYVYDRGWVTDRNFPVQTPVGARLARVLGDLIEVELGRVDVKGEREIDGAIYTLVDVGNPHAVTFVDDMSEIDVDGIGRSLQPGFEEGTNVEFSAVGAGGITMRVWERGAGETLACGTGMAAVVAAAQSRRGSPGTVEVTAPGGTATVEIRDGVAWMRAPADYVFRGSVGER
jgi:diaminopimelate epimerase